jgi:hypothetical protein
MCECLENALNDLTQRIFQHIYEEHPDISEEEYEEVMFDTKDIEVEFLLDNSEETDLEHLLVCYGLEQALMQHMRDYDELPKENVVYTLLFDALSQYQDMDTTYEDYVNWKQNIDF